ncbi:MAG: AAA-like domain-containing protein [Chloroflexota bacterium]
MELVPNPFTFGNPIRDPSRFYGRKHEIQEIVGRLLSSAFESTSIVGERRIGKTSLLYYLSNPEVAASLGLAPDRYSLVYTDFQGLTDITPRRFWQRVLDKMARTIGDQSLVVAIKRLQEREEFDLFDLEDLFESIGNHGLGIVLLLDEFEYVTQNVEFTADFFGGLRALAIHHRLALVPATRRELVDLCHSKEIKGSPFFNIFANVVLRPLGRGEVCDLIESYVGGTDFAFSPEEKELVWGLGGGHPCFVQMASHYLLEGKLQALPRDALKAFVTTRFDEQANPHYTYLWSHCSGSERISLLATLALGRQKPSKKTMPNLENISRLHPRAHLDVVSLVRRGLLEEADGTYALFSSSFGRWIGREITAPAGEEESKASVEEWLRERGREVLQPVKGILPRFRKDYWPLIGVLVREMSFEFAAAGVVELVKLLV